MALTEKQKKFIADIAGHVQKYAKQYGISVHSPIIAQAILESGWGESRLAAEYHNYFGLKCGSKWSGKSVNMKTQEEYSPGTKTTITDFFRVFDNMEDGVKGYFEFIQLPRYQNLKGIKDPKEYLQTIKDDGYATSSTYVADVYACVTSYGLTQYDGSAKEGGNKGMTEAQARQKVVGIFQGWIGLKRSDRSHAPIIDAYNGNKPLPRGYKVTYTDAYCATTTSAAAIKAGYTDIIPVECSCYYLIEKAKDMGIWQENDAYIPKPGDEVLYDWDDGANFATTDNQGTPEHVGMVEAISGSTIRVMEGNMSGGVVGRRNLQINGRYIRGFICPNYASKATEKAPEKSIDEIATEVLAGRWGNNPERKQRLEAAGYNYEAVQAVVNQKAKSGASAKKSVSAVAQEVLAGKWGNNPARKKALEAAGYDYNAVQAEVNRLCRK